MPPIAEPTGTLAAALEHTTRLLESDPLLASEQAAEILKVVPGHPTARLLLGVALRAAGDPAAALQAFEPSARRAAQLGRRPLREGSHAARARSTRRCARGSAPGDRAQAGHAGCLAGNRRPVDFARRRKGRTRPMPNISWHRPGPAADGGRAGVVREQDRPGGIAIARALEAPSRRMSPPSGCSQRWRAGCAAIETRRIFCSAAWSSPRASMPPAITMRWLSIGRIDRLLLCSRSIS